jgi:cystathionine beta-lyase/cystathionine gamma-synthase
LDQLEGKYARLEGLDLVRASPEVDPWEITSGLIFPSGMAAISAAILSRAEAGDTIVAQRALYGGTFGFLEAIAPRMGIRTVWVEGGDLEAWARALEAHPNARWVYVETPANPVMKVVDVAALAEMAQRGEARWLIVDNTFATPYGQRPLTLGADVVVHSTTKYLSGHGVVIGGAVVSHHVDYIRKALTPFRTKLGPIPSPFDAWLADLGLRTFELRMARHCESAMAVARFLDAHPKVEVVHYPGLPSHPDHATASRQMHAFGGMLSFELSGGFGAAERMLNALRLVTLGVSLGAVDSLISHPAGMSHASVPPEVREEMGISEGLVRLSVGIENVEDLLEDLERALEAA